MTREIFMIAGEPSGDSLGASLIRQINVSEGDSVSVTGVGGDLMAREGLVSLLPMSDLCVMGLLEIVAQLPRLLKLIQALVEEIEKRQPAVLVTIDLPDFNFQVAKRLKKRGIFKGKIIHYGAPTVWAWRPRRAKRLARFLDGMMCLFPFEPPYFEKEGLEALFVGHPLVENDPATFDRAGFRESLGLAPEDLCLGVFLGSRESEISIHAPVFTEVLALLRRSYPDLHVIVPTLPHLEYEVSQMTPPLGPNVSLIVTKERKWDAFVGCDFALAVSGTVGLELAYAGVPHVIAYKMNPLTALIVRFLVRVRFAHLGNIMMDDEIVPECIQGKCNALDIARALLSLMRKAEIRQAQKEALRNIGNLLKPEGGLSPSEKAARFVLAASQSTTSGP